MVFSLTNNSHDAFFFLSDSVEYYATPNGYYSWKFDGEEKKEILYGFLYLDLVQHQSIL